MSGIEIRVLSVLRALVEVAGMSLLARGALFLLVGEARKRNFVYQLLCVVTRPVVATVRFVLPGAVADKYVPTLAFCLLFGLWILLAYLRMVS